MKVRTKENYRKVKRILIAGVVLCLLYGGLRFIETLLFDGNPVIGFGALAGGAFLSLIILGTYIVFPHPTFFPLFTCTLSMVTFILVSVYMQAIDFHYFVMLIGAAFISSMKKYKLLLTFVIINIGATIVVFIFVFLGSLPWLDSFRFFTQFMLFLYGSFFIIWQTWNMEHREKTLAALNETATRLLSTENETFGEVMDKAIKPIAEAAGIDRVAVYRYSDKYLRFSQVYLWIGKTVPLEESMYEIPVKSPVSLWHESFVKGECINANLNNLTGIEVDYLGRFGIKSIFFVPVFEHGKLWGTITLEDHTNYRYFSDESVDLLQSAANLLTSVVIQEEMRNEIYSAEAENAMLDKMYRMKTELLTNISHEIKTPLTVISGNVQQAARLYTEAGGADNEIHTSLLEAKDETMRLSRLTENSLWLAAMQESREQMRVLDTARLIKSSAELHRYVIEKRGNTLKVNADENLPALFGNADQMTQVMTNLLSNANMHTQSGVIAVNAFADADHITVTVTDNGEGIPPELLPRVFERGETGSGSAGIGLAICRSIIESHGGSITIESEPDKGTAVIFRLPVQGGGEAADDV